MRYSSDQRAYIITGPTSGIGRATALELSRHGTIVLVGRNPEKLTRLRKRIESKRGSAVSVVCDLSDLASVHRAAAEIANLGLLIAGLLNNAGVMQLRSATKNAKGWDTTFATNHLGPFALTEALVPYLPDGVNILFVASAVEDPGRKPALAAGFRGGRFLSIEASARGEWAPGGSRKPGFDAYATSKQAVLASARALARETPRLRFNAIEPGLNPTTGLGGATGFLRILQNFVFPLLVPLFRPFVKILRTPRQSARVITRILTDPSGETGVYYDESGKPMQGSALARDPEFQERIVADTRAFLNAAYEK